MKTSKKAVLIAGGYGVVGEQIASILRQRNPDLNLIIAGRNLKKAEDLAARLGNAQALAVDLNKPDQLAPLIGEVSTIVAAVNDADNYLLVDAIRNDIPYLDITRWTSRMRQAVILATTEKMRAPVVFSSSWMGGVAALVAREGGKAMSSIDSIAIDILYSLADKAGPNSVEYMDQLDKKFDLTINGQITSKKPMTDPTSVTFPGGITTKTYRFDTPDLLTLPLLTHAKSVSARIAYDDKFSAGLLSFLIRIGVWRILSLPMFNNLRNSILFHPGKGGSHEIVITTKGRKGQLENTIRTTIVDPLGQTHLTALGSVIQIERILGLHGNSPTPPGITFPEQHDSPEIAMRTLSEHGVSVQFS